MTLFSRMPDLLLTGLELHALLNSLLIAVSVSILATVLAVFLVFVISFYPLPGKNIFSFLFLIPLLIPPYLHAFSWMHFLMLLSDYHLSGPLTAYGAAALRSLPGVIFISTLSFFPIAFFIILQSVRTLPGNLIDAGLQTAKPFRVLRMIIFPAIQPAVGTAFFLTFVTTFIAFDIPAFLGKKVFVTQIFTLFSLRNEISRALYLSSIPVVIFLIIWGVFLFVFVKNKPFFSMQFHAGGNLPKFALPNFVKFMILLLFVVLGVLSVFLPLSILQIKALLYKSEFYTVASQRVIVDTLFLAVVASSVIVFFSFLLYRSLYRYMLGRLLLLSLLIIPSITFGIVFISLFNRPWFDGIYATPAILIVAYFFRFAPLLCELFYTFEQQISPQLFDALRLVSAPTWKPFFVVLMPLYKPAFLLAWMFCFWLVATELPITLLIQPPGFITIITRLFIVLHYGAEDMMSLLTLALLFICALPIVAAHIFFRTYKSYG